MTATTVPTAAPPLANGRPRLDPSNLTLITEDDIFLFNEGSHFRMYDKLGAHLVNVGGKDGTYFAVWAPGAERVTVFGDFNDWDKGKNDLHPRGSSGIWEGFVEGAGEWTHYKYHVYSRYHMYRADKTDPYGFQQEIAPKTASIVRDLSYQWGDGDWMANRHRFNGLQSPMSIYEMHIGSWVRVPEEGYRSLSYRELAPRLTEYLLKQGYTHVEFLPVCEHPFFGSWGYQTTGYFSPTSRYGSAQDFMFLVDHLHQHGIGVILDWVPSHFPTDEHGLAFFDGTHCYEHGDPREGFHPDWNSCIFNYGRHEVRSFLISSAMFWLDKYHIDGLRVDAVASMLYRDYSRKQGEWVPNHYGGNENLEAIGFLRRFNEEVYRAFPDVQTFAEESTAWPMVSRPTWVGGLGFGFKWDMGWMHDTLVYLRRDPIHRQYHQGDLHFRMVYAFSENYVMPLSHDEVVHGKGSLMQQMSGDDWQKFANLRLLYGYMYGLPGKKLLYMGDDIAQWGEWRHDSSVDWHVLHHEPHEGVRRWVADLNHLYKRERALHELDCSPNGFQWIDCSDAGASVLAFQRKSATGGEPVIVICNFTPVLRHNYRLGVPAHGYYRELLNSDAHYYWGSGQGNDGGRWADWTWWHGQPSSVELTLPPLSVTFLQKVAGT